MKIEIVGRRHLRAWFAEFGDDWKVLLWNRYAVADGAGYIYDSDYSWEDILDATGLQGVGLLRAALFGDVKFVTTYVWLDGYGNLCSSDYLSETPYNEKTLLEWMANNPREWQDVHGGDTIDYTDRDDDKEIVIKNTKYEDFLIRDAFRSACCGDADEICDKYFRSNWCEMFGFFKEYDGYYPEDDNVEQIYLCEKYENCTWERALGETFENAQATTYNVVRSGLTIDDYKEYLEKRRCTNV